jgi:hypothetical protein
MLSSCAVEQPDTSSVSTAMTGKRRTVPGTGHAFMQPWVRPFMRLSGIWSGCSDANLRG